jgi:hypothetical protein
MLSVRILDAVSSVNAFEAATEIRASKGDAFTLYFQLIDDAKWRESAGFSPGGLRYMPNAGATLLVTFLNIDTALQFSRSATQPFANDTSIWSVQILSTDVIDSTCNLKFTLTEGAVSRTFAYKAAVLVDAVNEVC